jgi:ketosteroid isomerase-like protein
VSQADADLLRRAWDAFARGDVDAAVIALDPQVRWYAAGEPGDDGCHNRDDAATFIRETLADGRSAELLEIHDAGDCLVAVIQPHVPPEWQPKPKPHGEVVTVRDGKVKEMVVYPTVEDALAAAGLDERPES